MSWSHAEAMQGWEAAEERESWARCDAEKWKELAQEAGKALGITLSLLCGFLECPDWEAGTECEHNFRPTCPKIPPYLTRPYDKARAAGLLEEKP